MTTVQDNPNWKTGQVLIGIVDEYGSLWEGEPGASERVGDVEVCADDEETATVRVERDHLLKLLKIGGEQ